MPFEFNTKYWWSNLSTSQFFSIWNILQLLFCNWTNFKGTINTSSGLQMIVILLASGAMEPKFCTGTTFMFPELPKKFESSTITQSSTNDHFITFNDNHHFDNVRVILLDSNFMGSSGNIKVVSVQNLGCIAASIWALETKRMKIICRPDELWTVPCFTKIYE